MRKIAFIVFILFTVSIFTACGSKDNTSESSISVIGTSYNSSLKKEPLEEEIAVLKDKVAELNEQIKKYEEELAQYKKSDDDSLKKELLEEENAALKGKITDLNLQIRKYEEELAQLKESGNPGSPAYEDMQIVKSIEADLNGDNENEHITLSCDQYGNMFLLSVNRLSVVAFGSNIDREIVIVDIDTKDKIKEIAIPESGPSDDLSTHFFVYTRKFIDYIGTLGGKPGTGITVRGNDTITATTRGSVLHTWFHDEEYKLLRNHSLEKIEPADGLYSMGNYKVKVAISIPIYEVPERDVLRKLVVGEEVYLVASNDRDLVLIETKDGEQGWITIEKFYDIKGTGYNAGQVFEGLCFAD